MKFIIKFKDGKLSLVVKLFKMVSFFKIKYKVKVILVIKGKKIVEIRSGV